MHQITRREGNLIVVRVSGQLSQDDYDELIPAWNDVIATRGSMRMLLIMEDFHGWEPKAAWDDLKFDLTHAGRVQRVAMVGEKKWEKWLAKIGSVFSPERVRYFDLKDLAEAEQWVEAD